MGSENRKEREKAERRRQILAAAMKLFHEEGFERVSIRAIAEQIEYSPTMIYLYFKDKDDILFALHVDGFRLLLERQEGVQPIADPIERLSAHGREYVRFALEHPEYYDLMFIDRSVPKKFTSDTEWKEGGASYQILRKNVSECIAAGYFPNENHDAVTFALWSLVHGIASLILRSRTVMIPPEALQLLVDGALTSTRTMMIRTRHT